MGDSASRSVAANARQACQELAEAVAGVPDAVVTDACSELTAARRIACYGVGREGLMLRALTMRLYHLGLDAHAVGEMTTPPLADGDLLVVSAGPGTFATVDALMAVARHARARVLLFTADTDAALAARADRVVSIPARTMAANDRDAVLPMGSAYEGAQYVLFELIVNALQKRLGVEERAMRERHTNLE